MATVGERLIHFRKKRGLTQYDIAGYLNVARPTYTNWEANRAEPDLSTLIKISEYLGISLDTLVGRKCDIDVQLEEIKTKISYLPLAKQQAILNSLLDYTDMVKKHFIE
ncbi:MULTISPECIES: helix-turn-helix domain-containing protein [Bacillus cereus group]|uniref:helix-turn-helix domain-containing protein n=1 Tax=Bacillus cereus group TaxID=86661 RepID=UPI0005CF5E47|nr:MULTISPECIES: helix-turn-helix transcriptional regulator [Bacillus cereus group]